MIKNGLDRANTSSQNVANNINILSSVPCCHASIKLDVNSRTECEWSESIESTKPWLAMTWFDWQQTDGIGWDIKESSYANSKYLLS